MARIRTIKPEFPQSESMGRVSRDARLLFVMLWTLVDDEGRTRGASRMLASILFPYDDDAPGLIDTWLSELDREGCLIRYVADGNTYIEIANWLIHQKIDRPSKSKIPGPEKGTRILANPRESSSLDQGSRIKDQGRDQGPLVRDEQADMFPVAAVATTTKKASRTDEDPCAALRRKTWMSYSDAYFARYQTEPVRDAKANTHIKQIVASLGEEAPEVAAFFVRIQDAYYLRRSHQLDMLVSNAPSIRTQWATGRQMTGAMAQAAERLGGEVMGILQGIDMDAPFDGGPVMKGSGQ